MPNPKTYKTIGALLASGIIAGCTTSNSFVDYDKRQMYSGGNAGNIEFMEIGLVDASTQGFVWTSCDEMVTQVSDQLREEARKVGGNAIINVRWRDFDSGMLVRHPTCTTAWGWTAVPPLLGIAWPWNKQVLACRRKRRERRAARINPVRKTQRLIIRI